MLRFGASAVYPFNSQNQHKYTKSIKVACDSTRALMQTFKCKNKNNSLTKYENSFIYSNAYSQDFGTQREGQNKLNQSENIGYINRYEMWIAFRIKQGVCTLLIRNFWVLRKPSKRKSMTIWCNIRTRLGWISLSLRQLTGSVATAAGCLGRSPFPSFKAFTKSSLTLHWNKTL